MSSVYIIEVNPRSSRTVPFLSKATGFSLADIATEVILGHSLKEQGIFGIYPDGKGPLVRQGARLLLRTRSSGLDAYLSPEMKSTGEAIGYDKRSHSRAMYKALQASGMKLQNYGTVVVTLADEDKEEALPLVRSFYNMGFNIAATEGTAAFLKNNGIRTRRLGKLSEGSSEILDLIRCGLRELRHQHARCLLRHAQQGRRVHPPLRDRKRRHDLHLARHRPHRYGGAGGDDHLRLHHQRGVKILFWKADGLPGSFAKGFREELPGSLFVVQTSHFDRFLYSGFSS